MNVYDSERIAEGLKPLGYVTSSLETADLVIANTCSIREKAEHKVFSFLGLLADMKRKNPNIIIGVGGCVAQQEGKKMLARVPYLDVVFGTHAIARLPQIIKQIELNRRTVVDIEMLERIEEIPAAPELTTRTNR